MKFINLTTRLGMLAIFLGFIACQSSSKEESTEEISKPTEIQFTSSSEEALESFKKGLVYFDLGGGNQDERKYFTEAVEKDPNFMAGYLYRAMTSGSAAEFVADLEKASQLQEGVTEPEKMIYEMVNTFRTSDWDKRMEVAKSFMEKYPEMPRAHFWVALAYQQNNQFEECRKHYQDAVDADPQWIGGYSGLGNSYLFDDPKDFTKAEEMAVKMVELQPGLAATHIFLGDTYRAQRDLEKARDAYSKAIETQSDNPIAYLKKGHANSFLGNLDEARADYQQGRQYDDNKGGSLIYEAYTYLYENDHKKALDWLEEQTMNIEDMGIAESRINAAKITCMNSCAWIALHHGEKDHIKKILANRDPISEQIGLDVGTEEGVAQNAANRLFWTSLAAAMDGDYETARSKAEEGKTKLDIVNNPRKLEQYHFAHGYINMKEGNFEEAISHLEQSNLNNQYMKYNLAMAYEKAGNTDKAMELLREIDDYNFNGWDYALIRNAVKEKLGTSS